jgi:hypothetical protein
MFNLDTRLRRVVCIVDSHDKVQILISNRVAASEKATTVFYHSKTGIFGLHPTRGVFVCVYVCL